MKRNKQCQYNCKYHNENPFGKCEICDNLHLACNLHRPKYDRNERRNDFISYALRKAKGLVSEDLVIKEAGKKFDKANPIKTTEGDNIYVWPLIVLVLIILGSLIYYGH